MNMAFIRKLNGFLKSDTSRCDISIRKSFVAFAASMLLFVLIIAAVTVVTYRAFIIDLQAYSVRTTLLNALTEHLLDENECFRLVVMRRTGEISDDLAAAHSKTQTLLAQVRRMFDDQSETECRLFLQAIDETYHSYSLLCDEVFRLQSNGFSHILTYYDALAAAKYCGSYTTQLSRINADNCMRICNATTSLMSTCLIICFIISTFGVMLMVSFWKYAGNNLVRPLGELTDAATRISENNLDLPDIEQTNNLEMNQLIVGFNQMKSSMQQSLQHQHQINLMEAELHQKEIDRLKTERLLEQAQLGMLRSQMNPHFLFNTLNIIAGMSEIEHAQTTRALVTNLAELLRYNLQKPQDMILLEEEVQICSKYISIQVLRFGDRIRFLVDCQKEALLCPVPIFTLQPLVENAVIHGMQIREKNGQVRIRIRRCGDLVTIRVTDNGSGIPREKAVRMFTESTQGDSSGIGLLTVKKRIERLCRDGTLTIRSVPFLGTTAQVSFRV